MRVVVLGATGNIGTSLLRSLAEEEKVESILGLARRLPSLAMPKVEWASADVTSDDLAPHFDGADAVVSLHWLIQPSRDWNKQWMVNVEGNSRLMRAVKEAGVSALAYSSSVGVYSPGPKDRAVDESWPRDGTPTSYYARHKAEVERRLDRFEAENPDVRVVRIRPALVFKKEAVQGIRRLFGGPFVPTILARPSLINLIPKMEDLRGQVVHSYDLGEAFRRALVYSSSVGVYSPGPKNRAVDESWPRDGIPTSYYARHKAEVERRLDRFEAENPEVRVVRIRPGLVFKKEAAQGIRRLFGGPFVPTVLARPSLINLIPEMEDLRGQVVHSYDVGEAFHQALVRDVRGAFNVAADPVLDAREAGRILNARPLPVPARAARAGVELSWRLRLQPVTPGWLDMALNVPVMDTTRARSELGWTPQRSAEDALLDLLEGLHTGADFPTPPLARETGGPFRIREIFTGVGGREP